jgi:hypothetical protein
MEDFGNFARLIDAIRPWLIHIVIVGGWAHRLHRFHPLASVQEYQSLRTRDVDLAFSPNAPLEGDLNEALSKAGFNAELSGEYTPPVTHYRLGTQDAGFFAEFLTVKKGDGLRRDGKSDLTVAKAGIIAQKLRHLELLLEAPWIVHITADTKIPIEHPVDVSVPNPVSFIVQKLLVQNIAMRKNRRRTCCISMIRWSYSVPRSKGYERYGKRKCALRCPRGRRRG